MGVLGLTDMRLVSGGLLVMTLKIGVVLDVTVVVRRWAAGLVLTGRVLGINRRVAMVISMVLLVLWATGLSIPPSSLLLRKSSHYWGAFSCPWRLSPSSPSKCTIPGMT